MLHHHEIPTSSLIEGGARMVALASVLRASVNTHKQYRTEASRSKRAVRGDVMTLTMRFQCQWFLNDR